eukprot:Sspe_Gene.111727::Locus_93859_Transcript_1_1_Confidence_1.000_Length_848::g.111727::m.111727
MAASRWNNGCASRACTRRTLLLSNTFLMLAGIALVVTASIALSKPSWLEVCTECAQLLIAGIILGSALFVHSILGFIAILKRKRWLLLGYGAVHVAWLVLFVSSIVLLALVYNGEMNDQMNTLWTNWVKNRPKTICELQDKLECSGWKTCCNLDHPGCFARNETEALTQCPQTCIDSECSCNQHTDTCEATIDDFIHTYYPIGLAISSAVFIVLVVCIVLTMRQWLFLRKHWHTINEDDDLVARGRDRDDFYEDEVE